MNEVAGVMVWKGNATRFSRILILRRDFWYKCVVRQLDDKITEEDKLQRDKRLFVHWTCN